MAKPRKDGTPANHSALKHKPWTNALQLALKRVDKGKASPRLTRLAEKAVKMGLAGDIRAMEMIADRTEGKVATTVNVRTITSLADLTEDELLALARGGKGQE